MYNCYKYNSFLKIKDHWTFVSGLGQIKALALAVLAGSVTHPK